MDMFKITTEIRSILLASGEITAVIEEKVSPIIAPENTAGDFIVYQRDGFKQEYTQMGIASQSPLVNVTAVSDNYDRSQNLASLIYDTLSGDFRDPDITIQLEDSTEDFIDNKYIQILQFLIKQN